MKIILTKFLALSGIIIALPFVSPGQGQSLPRAEERTLHHEVPDDPYMPNAFGNSKTSPAMRYKSTGIFTTQVNINSNGENILGDAANEPSIGVDPTNPDRMVIGWRQFDNVYSNFRQAGWAYTIDGGQTWTFPGKIEEGIFRSDPVLDFDSAGNAFYNSLTSNNDVYTCKVFKSIDGGAQWDAGAAARGGDKQWMTIDRSGGPGMGYIYSAWNQVFSSCYPGASTRSTDTGASFELCEEVMGDPYWGTMAVGNDGELWTAGTSYFAGIMVSKATTAWDPTFPLIWDYYTDVDLDGYLHAGPSVNPAGLLGQASIDIDRSNGPGRGNIYVLASVVRYFVNDSADVMFAKSTDGGITWTSPLRINDDAGTDAFQWFGTMSVAPDGRIDAIWLDTRDAPGSVMSRLYYSYSTDQGETWSVNEPLSDEFDPHVGWPQQNKMGDYFDMESDLTGVRLAWANTLNGEEDVYYSYITPDLTGIKDKSGEKDPVSIESYPNPFIDNTTIGYTLHAASDVAITIYDMYGKLVTTLVNEKQSAGVHHVEWAAGVIPPGFYECRLEASGQVKHTSLIRSR